MASKTLEHRDRDVSDSITCQRCHQPLMLDQSIASLTPAQHALLTSALPTPSYSSNLDPKAKLAALPPSAHPASKIWAEANHLSLPSTPGAGPSRFPASVAESFVLLSDSTIIPPTRQPSISLPHNSQNLAAHLHSILSSSTPLSHPLCIECTTLLTTEFQKKAEELTRERDAYIAFEQGIQRNREQVKRRSKDKRRGQNGIKGDDEGLGEYDGEGDEDEWKELNRRKKELEEEEERLTKVLEEKEKELQEAQADEARVKEEEKEVEQEENEFLLSHANLSTELAHLASALSTAKTHLLLSSSLLAHLESTNVYNDAFQIGHVPLSSSGSGVTVGTINGLRLGGRPTVEWEEINAAWGLVALCLNRVADKVGCVFGTYKIVPLGSFSRVEELPPAKNVYELYASSDISPARLLQNRRFNYALVGLLDCIKQLVEFGRRNGKGWARGDIEIHKDRISGHSIRLPGISSMPLGLPSMSIMGLGAAGSSSSSSTSAITTAANTAANAHSNGSGGGGDGTAEESWTRACRAVLAVLKRVLIVESEADRGDAVTNGLIRAGR